MKLKEKHRKDILEKLGESLAHIPDVRIDVPINVITLGYSGDTTSGAPVMVLNRVRPNVIIPEASLRELAKSKLPDVEGPSKEQLAKEHLGVIEDVKRLVREAIPKSAEIKRFYPIIETEQTKQAKKDREELKKKVLEALKDIPGIEIRWIARTMRYGGSRGVTIVKSTDPNDSILLIIIPESYVLDEWRKEQREEKGEEPSPPIPNTYHRILESFRSKIKKQVIDLMPVVGKIDNRKKMVQASIVDEQGKSVAGASVPKK